MLSFWGVRGGSTGASVARSVLNGSGLYGPGSRG